MTENNFICWKALKQYATASVYWTLRPRDCNKHNCTASSAILLAGCDLDSKSTLTRASIQLNALPY